MASTKSWLDFFKIRASWGQNGNNSISKYQYLATIALSGDSGDSGYKFGSDMLTSTSGTPNVGAYANIVPNPDLTWETSEQLDFGFDARFLNSRLGVTFDWYKKTTIIRNFLAFPKATQFRIHTEMNEHPEMIGAEFLQCGFGGFINFII